MTKIPDEVPAANATFPITNSWLAVKEGSPAGIGR
jgi:hypothetical protein